MSSTSPNMGLVLPDVNDEVTDTIADLAANFTLLDAIWPVGSIYMSTQSTDPGTFLGGTWSRIQDKFLLGASSTYPAGSTGGATKHAHSKAADGSPNPYPTSTVANSAGDYGIGKGSITATQTHLPPYLSVYMWERTA